MSHATGLHFHPAKILLPINFTSSSYAVLDEAIELTRQFQFELDLIHIIPMLPNIMGAEFFEETVVRQRTKDHAEQQLAARVTSLPPPRNPGTFPYRS